MISSFTANNRAPYRDIVIYINGREQRSLEQSNVDRISSDYGSVNITLNLNETLVFVVRAVGNVSVLNASSDQRFTCATDFACNSETRRDVANRQLLCVLRSPVELSDDGRMLLVLLNHSVELVKVVIKCK